MLSPPSPPRAVLEVGTWTSWCAPYAWSDLDAQAISAGLGGTYACGECTSSIHELRRLRTYVIHSSSYAHSGPALHSGKPDTRRCLWLTSLCSPSDSTPMQRARGGCTVSLRTRTRGLAS